MTLSDGAVAHLLRVTAEPDFSGTRYRVAGVLGRGGMAVVYEADDVDLERRVALKVLAVELFDEAEAERLRHEARVVASLEHPGIVPVHDVGTLPDGRVYYAMKIVRGRRLDASLDQQTLTERLRLFLRVCEPVAFAHARGVVHCDLKPANIMIGAFGEVLVMDWGLAALTAHNAAAEGGTAGYAAPEQSAGAAVDARADVYALGVILREICGLMPPALRAVAAMATAPDPGARFSDAAALADDVARYLDGQRMASYDATIAELLEQWARRNAALVGIVGAYLLMRVLVFAWFRS